MKKILRHLIHLLAIVSLVWLLSWNMRYLYAIYFADSKKPVEVYGKVGALIVSSLSNRVSIWIEGDRETRWDLFLDGDNALHLMRNFTPSEPVRLSGYVASRGRHLAVQMENANFALDSEALVTRSNTLFILGLGMNGVVLALLLDAFLRVRKRKD